MRLFFAFFVLFMRFFLVLDENRVYYVNSSLFSLITGMIP